MAVHVNDVDDHKQEDTVPAFLCQSLHRLQQLVTSVFDGRRAGRLNRADCKRCVAYRELLEVRGKQRLGCTCVEIGSSRGENLLAVLLDILTRNFGKDGSNTLIARRTGRRTQDQGIIQQPRQ